MNTATADAREFRRLCREGMLFEVQAWIRSGKPLPQDGDGKEAPLALAAGKGFHSLVKLLLEQTPSQACRDEALARAGAGGNPEVCRLLLANGAGVHLVRAAEVIQCGNLEVADLLMSAKMDIETDYPLAHAIVNHSKEALAFLKRCRRRSKSVRRQGAMALKYFVTEDDEWQATRVKRAGADARLRVPDLYPRWKNCRWETSALYEAACSGTYRMLLRMGVRKSDDIPDLLDIACLRMNRAKVLHILSRSGWPINDQADGGSSVLHRCLRKLGHGGYFHMLSATKEAEEAWAFATELVRRGARWVPDRSMLRDVRFYLRFADRHRAVELARLLVEGKGASRETVTTLFGTPMIRRWLGSDTEQIDKIIGIVKRRHRAE